MTKKKPLIGISACLLGEAVRYNKGNTQDKWITNELNKYVDFYPVCPEMDMGLGVPREEIHLYYTKDDPKNQKLRSKFSKVELTTLANKTYDEMNEKSDKELLDGFILMRKSPSCGLGNIKTVRDDEEGNIKLLQGLYARNLEKRYPSLPKEDSGRMKNLVLREHFVKNIFAHFRFTDLEIKSSALQEFHKKYKYVLMEHDQDNMKLLGNVIANHEKFPIDKVFEDYKYLFFITMNIPATVQNRYNVLHHLMGYLKKRLKREDKENMIEMFGDYKDGITSYNISVSLINFFVKKYKIDYLEDHYYFNLYPKELKVNKIL